MFTPAEFAVLHGANPETGKPLDFLRYAYLLAPLDDLSPRVVLMKGSQVGATVLALMRALWFVGQRQAQTLYLFPTHRSAARFSRGRVTTLLERSPALRSLFQSHKNTAHLRSGTVNLYCHGARSRTELLSMPIQYLTIDERDEMYQTDPHGRQPWSALDLARQRLAGQGENWELNLSTPTLPGLGIAAEFANTDQHHFHLTCPKCGDRAPLQWPASYFWSEDDSDRRPAAFGCAACRQPWSDEEAAHAKATGTWRPAYPGRAVRGYHIPQALSPACTAARVVTAFREAEGNPAALQVFHNSILGLPHQTGGERLSREELLAAQVGGGPMLDSSLQPCMLGADVGPTWLHCVVLRPEGTACRVVQVVAVRDWNGLAELLRRFRVTSFVVDAQPETHAARRFVQDRLGGWLCYYGGRDEPRIQADTRTVTVARTVELDHTFARLREGSLRLPTNLPSEFFQHLESLARFLRPAAGGGIRAEYLETHGPDHYAHALTYALLAYRLAPRPGQFLVTPPTAGKVAWE